MFFIKLSTKKYKIKKNGFTLIELLISLIIFSMLIAIASYSFGFYVNLIKKIINPYPAQALKLTYLQDSLRDIFFYTIEKSDLFNKKIFYIYFKGEKNNIEFITANFLNKDSIFLCKLFLDNNKNLILEGSDIYSKNNNYKNPKLVDPVKVILLKNVSSLQIVYITNNIKTETITNKIPNLIMLSIQKTNGKRVTIYAKVQSNFSQKKGITVFLYAPNI